ncbi:RNA polymerase sigma factor [Flavobacterium procerum]|uniref:RNA polymerase sigma factor n=1 Tax=Flavobacterium procerum TaxID=1455569 RepID=A0ABV6BS18_9FLAO
MKNSYINKQLIEDFKNDSNQAFKEIYLAYYQDLCVYANSYTRDKQASEDLVQNILLRFWENRASFNVQQNIKSYLYKAVYNSFLDSVRKEKTLNKNLEDLRYSLLSSINEEDPETIDERIAVLKSEIERLPKRCKEIFILNKYESLKYQQIAEKLNISINTVENQIGKAYKILRTKLSDKNYLTMFLSLIFKGKKRFHISNF